MQQALLIISTLVFSLYAILIIYFRLGWSALREFTPSVKKDLLTRISIIIPARNEEQNINACLDSILNQSYPPGLFEVLVVDDHSTDKTAALVKEYASQNVKLISLKELVTNPSLNSYKKKAIEIAVQQSSAELIVTTDADTIVSPTWLQTIADFYDQNNPVFIVMPVTYTCNNSFLEKFQALDFMTLQGITGAAVNKKTLSMCNGANLAYTKKGFEEVGGFTNIDNIASGDDMLLMHKIYKKYPRRVNYLKSKHVIVQTQPMHTVKDFFNQRIRWASKADQYDDKRIFAVLLVVYLFNCLLVALPVITIFYNPAFNARLYPFGFVFSLFEYWLFILILKTIIELYFLFPVAGFFNKRKLLWLFPLMQPFHIIYTILAGWLGKFGTYQWKGRIVK
jgi:cellulose synthase/poly-beta-1,6-N-acetylglucosamine synthase-like glycosyltransferase